MFPIEKVWELSKQTILVVDEVSKNQLAIDFLWENVKLLEQVTMWMKVDCEYTTRVNMTTNRIFNRITGKAIQEYEEA
jgi:hypothetical protein